MPACATLWGFDLSLNPCSWQNGVKSELQFPVTCSCLLQCDEVQAAARNDCIEKMPALPKTNLSAGFTLHGRKPPWRGTPKGINWPELQVTYDPALVARLHSDAAVSRARRLCNGHGIWTAPLRFGASKSAPPECICLPGHSGPDCSTPPLQTVDRCMNRCSNAGRCVHGTCLCHEHASGMDCSQPVPPWAPSESAPARPGSGSGSGSGAREQRRRSGAAAQGALSPRIYVYDVPARVTSWLALPTLGAHDQACQLPSAGCWWIGGIDPAYAADVALLRRMLRSPHRTLDPEEADFFFVPLIQSIGFRSLRFGACRARPRAPARARPHSRQPGCESSVHAPGCAGQYMPSAGASRQINYTVQYVKHVGPYWNRSRGADHMLTLTGDLGSTWLRARLPELEHVMFLTHWGYSCVGAPVSGSGYNCVTNMGFRSHHTGQDIVIPPLQRPAELLPASPWMDAKQARFGGVLERGRKFDYLLYFVGKVHRSKAEGDSYSHGVRQRLFAQHRNRTDFYLRERPGASALELETVRSSKFCFAPHGVGFGMRQFNAIAAGCVPLIIEVRPADDKEFGGALEQVYEEVLPWDEFTLRVNRSQIPELPRLLREVTPAEHEAMLRAAACVWPRLFWLHAFGGDTHDAQLERPPPQCNAACLEQLRTLVGFDAFETLMALLRRRVDRVNASSASDPHSWHTPAVRPPTAPLRHARLLAAARLTLWCVAGELHEGA